MKRRREHGECDTREGGRGCLVFGTKICTIDESRSSEEMGDERDEEERSVMVGSGSSNRSCSCVRLHVDQRLGN